MTNYVSFSLWGDKPIYTIGAIRNSEIINEIYPDWKMILYYDDSVPFQIIDELKKNNVILINMTGSKIFGPFWRFLASDLEGSKFIIFRDTDSRLSLREKVAVDHWIESGKSIHIMRDHPAHRIPYGSNKLGILAGMWGIKSHFLPMTEMVEEFNKNKKLSYGADQTFLQKIYDNFIEDMLTHDDFHEKKPFPTKRNGLSFVGQRIDENDNPVGNDHLILLNYEDRLRFNGF